MILEYWFEGEPFQWECDGWKYGVATIIANDINDRRAENSDDFSLCKMQDVYDAFELCDTWESLDLDEFVDELTDMYEDDARYDYMESKTPSEYGW